MRTYRKRLIACAGYIGFLAVIVPAAVLGGGRPATRRGPFPAVERAGRDRDAGRLWKARERLGSVLSLDPADQEVLALLGRVHYEMKDLPNAGRYWFLTEAEGPEVEKATAAMHERYGFPELLRQLPARTAIAHYPPSVQARLRELQQRAAAQDITWNPGAEAPFAAGAARGSFRDRVVDAAVVGFFVVVGPGLSLLGLATAVGIIFAVT